MPRALFRFVVGAGICLAALLAGILLLPPIARYFHPPSALYLHIDSLPGTTVTVDSDNPSAPHSFGPAARELRISPVSHGIYRIRVQFSDGQTVWAQFFHSDAAVRRRLDVFVTASPERGYVRFRETANHEELLFEGDARPGETTAEKPFILDSI